MANAADLEVRVSADVSDAERGLQRLSQHVQSFGESFKQGLALGAGITAFTTGLHALEAGFGAIKSSAIDFNQTIDTARASMGKFFDNATSLNNSIADLNALAAKTPFAFEGLLVAQQRTIGAARSADELKQNMDAIAVTAANTGRVSTANMERISLALGQMQAKGHLAGGELLQLTEAGVNMGEILAKHFGVSTAAIQKMASEGKISSQDVFAAMREYAADPRNRQALDELAKTWEGSWSTISDVGKTVIAQTFRPIYDAITQLAYGFGQFLQSEQFQTWAEAVRIGFAGAVEGVKGFLSNLAPLGEAIKTAFGQATNGDFSGAFATLGDGIRAALGTALSTAEEFASGMFGAGGHLIAEFARGIWETGSSLVSGAINGIAEIIASFLVGNSPPPAGPLADIDKGGAAVADAWVGGFGGVMLKGTEAVVSGVKDKIAGLKDASRDLAGQIRDIAEEMAGVDHAIRGVRERIEDAKAGFAEAKRIVQEQAEATKASYADAIAGVRDQIQTIKDAHEQATRGVQDQIEEIKDRYTKLLDGVRDQIQSVKDGFAEQTRDTQDKIEAVKDRYEGMLNSVRDRIAKIKDAQTDQLAPLEKQLASLRDASKEMRAQYDAQQAILRARTQQLMLDALGDPKQRAALQGQLATVNAQQEQLDLQQQIAEAQAKLADATTTPQEAASLRLKLQQLAIQKQLADMVNVTALGEATRQKVLQDAEGERLSTTRAIEDANNRLLALPIEEKIASIKQEGEDALRPLTARMAELERGQKTALEPLTDRLREIKREEADALKPLEARLKGLQREQRDALEPLQDRLVSIKREETDALKPLEQKLKDLQRESDNWGRVFAAELAAIDQQQRDTLKPLDDQLRNLTRQKETLTEHRAELERQKQVISEQISLLNEQEQAAKRAAAAGGAPVAGAPAGGLHVDLSPEAKDAQDNAKKAGAKIAQGISDGFNEWLTEHKSDFIAGGIGAALGGLAFGPVGAAVGAGLGVSIWESLNAKLTAGGFDFEGFKTKMFDSLNTLVEAVKGEWKPPGEGEWVDPFVQGVGEFGLKVNEFVKTYWPPLRDAFVWLRDEGGPKVVQAVKDIWTWFSNLNQALKDNGTYKAVGDAFQAIKDQAAPLWDGLKKLWDGLTSGAGGGLNLTMKDFGLIVKALITPVLDTADAIATMARVTVDGALVFLKMNQGMAALRNGEFGKASELFGAAKDAAVDAFTAIGENGDRFQKRHSELWAATSADVKTATGDIATNVGTMKTDLDKTMTGIKSDQETSWEAIRKTIALKLSGGSEDTIEGLIASRWGLIRSKIDEVVGKEGAADSIVDIVNVGWSSIKEITKRLLAGDTDSAQFIASSAWGQIKRDLGNIMGTENDEDTIAGKAAAGWKKIKESANQTLFGDGSDGDSGGVVGLAKKMGGDIKAKFVEWGTTGSDFLQSVLDLGSSILASIRTGINKALGGDDGNGGFWQWLKENLIDKIPESIRSILHLDNDTGEMAKVGERMIEELEIGIKNRWPKLTDLLSNLSGSIAASGDLDDWLNAAIQITGVGQGWLSGLRWLAQHESSGDPTAVNPEDVGNGEHAAGLMQTIPSTFAAYRDDSLPDNIFDPIANAVAAINYIKRRYGSIEDVIDGWSERGGYAKGGILPTDMTAIGRDGGIYRLHSGEGVFNRDQMAHLAPVAAFRGGGNDAPIQTHRIEIALGGRIAEEIYVVGRDLAIRRGRVPSGSAS